MIRELEGATIGQYQIQRQLTRGGMSDIYLAHDRNTNKTVVIKMVSNGSEEYYARFQQEVSAVAGLSHNHILPAFDHGEFASWRYLVTPYIEYGTLHNRLADGPLSLREAGQILEQLADALAFAHKQGIIHRDIKPSNVLLRDGEHVYLADFGLARKVGQNIGLTQSGLVMGTPDYMAPELAEEMATPLSDIYSLGVLLYQMIAGRVPFKANTAVGIFLKHINEFPLPPSAWNPSIPEAVDRVILRALEKDPRKRFKTANEFALAYQQAVAWAENQQYAVEVRVSLSPIIKIVPAPKAASKQNWFIGRDKILAFAFGTPLLLFVIPMLLGFAFYTSQSASVKPALINVQAVGRVERPKLAPTPTLTLKSTPIATATTALSLAQPAVSQNQQNRNAHNAHNNINAPGRDTSTGNSINNVGSDKYSNNDDSTQSVNSSDSATNNDPHDDSNGYVEKSSGSGQSSGNGQMQSDDNTSNGGDQAHSK